MRFGFAGREFYLTSALTLAYLRLCIFRSHFREFKSQRADERRGSPPAKTAITRVAKVASDRETASSLQKAKIHRKATKMTRTKLNTISTNRECTGNARLPPPPPSPVIPASISRNARRPARNSIYIFMTIHLYPMVRHSRGPPPPPESLINSCCPARAPLNFSSWGIKNKEKERTDRLRRATLWQFVHSSYTKSFRVRARC